MADEDEKFGLLVQYSEPFPDGKAAVRMLSDTCEFEFMCNSQEDAKEMVEGILALFHKHAIVNGTFKLN